MKGVATEVCANLREDRATGDTRTLWMLVIRNVSGQSSSKENNGGKMTKFLFYMWKTHHYPGLDSPINNAFKYNRKSRVNLKSQLQKFSCSSSTTILNLIRSLHPYFIGADRGMMMLKGKFMVERRTVIWQISSTFPIIKGDIKYH